VRSLGPGCVRVRVVAAPGAHNERVEPDDHPFQDLADSEVEDSVRGARAVRVIQDFTNLTQHDIQMAVTHRQLSPMAMEAQLEAAVAVANSYLAKVRNAAAEERAGLPPDHPPKVTEDTPEP